MGKTFRKDRNGKTHKESLKKKVARYKCRCERCVGKNKEVDRTAEKDFEIELKTIIEEGVDCDIPEQDKILKQIMNR